MLGLATSAIAWLGAKRRQSACFTIHGVVTACLIVVRPDCSLRKRRFAVGLIRAVLSLQSESLLLVCVLAKVEGALRAVDWAFLGCRATSTTTDASPCIEAKFAQRGCMYVRASVPCAKPRSDLTRPRLLAGSTRSWHWGSHTRHSESLHRLHSAITTDESIRCDVSHPRWRRYCRANNGSPQ